MLTFSAFASLAQFGAGVAFALTFFLEPIAARDRKFRNEIQQSLYLVPSDDKPKNLEAKSDLWEKMIALDNQSRSAFNSSKGPMWLIYLGAAFNMFVLLGVTVAPDAELSLCWVWGLLILTTLPTLLGTALLMWISRRIKKPS